MLRAQKYVDAVYYHELSRQLHALGYATETTKTGFEIKGISEATRERFSKRHDKIQELTAQLIANGARRNEKGLATAVAHDNRVRKQPRHSAKLLRSDWLQQMPEQERTALDTTLAKASTNGQQLNGQMPDYQKSFDWADRHPFERKSVVRDVELWTDAMRELRGTGATVAGLKERFAARAYVRDQDGRRVTTPETLTREHQLIALVQVGKGQYAPLLDNIPGPSPALNVGQKKAVETLAGQPRFSHGVPRRRRDREEFHAGRIEPSADQRRCGRRCRRFAEQSGAGPGKKWLFAGADPGQLASDKPRKVWLSHSTGRGRPGGRLGFSQAPGAGQGEQLPGHRQRRHPQHGAVAATDALVAIQRYAEPTVAWLSATTATIQRQQAAWYRKAVAAADAGLPARASQILEGNRAVLDVAIRDKHADVAKSFLPAFWRW
jgi:hypothetical protein